MKEVTIDSILRDHYTALSSDKLSDDNIKIDTDLLAEDSKSKYLVTFAEFLNKLAMKNYKISDKIMLKLLNIIDYEGYQYQIINGYIRIITETMNWNLQDVKSVVFEPKESIEYINEYLSMDIDKVVYYTNDNKFIISGIRMLIEIDDPEKLIEDDFYKWNDKYSKLCDIVYFYYRYKYNLYYTSLYSHRDRLLMALPLLEEENIENFDALIQQDYSISEISIILEMYYRYNEIPLEESLTEVTNKNIRRLIELKMFNKTNEQLALEISDNIDLWEAFNRNNNDLGTQSLDIAIEIYHKYPNIYSIHDDIELIDLIITKYSNDAYFYIRQILLDMNYKNFCNYFITIFSKINNYISLEERDSLISECISGLILLKNEEVDTALQNLYDNLICNHNTNISIDLKHITDIIHDNIINI